MSLRLYSSKNSGAFAVAAALDKAKFDYETIDIKLAAGDQHRQEFERISPMRQVPALVLADGTLMTESAAIVIHLAALHPEAGLAPRPGTPAHARFLRWMLFMAVNLYEADLRYYYPERYTSDPSGIDSVKASGAKHMARGFTIIEREALADGGFVAGPALSIADAYLAMLSKWSPEPVKLPGIARVVAAVASDPAYGQQWRQHGYAD